MGGFFLTPADRRRITSGLNKIDFYSKGQTPQRRKRGRLTEGTEVVNSGDTFQIIRGDVSEVFSVVVPATDYAPKTTYRYCKIKDNILSFEEDSRTPDEAEVKIAFADDDIPNVGDTIWAVYHPGILVIPPTGDYDYGSEIIIDWYKFPFDDEPQVVLIDEDIYLDPDADDPTKPRGVKEEDPAVNLTSDNYIFTDVEAEENTGVIFQNPVPDDDTNYDDNLLDDGLPLWAYTRILLNLKVYRDPIKVKIGSGTAQTADSSHITLADGSCSITNFYKDGFLTIVGGEGEGDTEYKITSSDGVSFVCAITPAWVHGTPDAMSEYEIYKKEPGYDDDPSIHKMILSWTVIDDESQDYPRKIVRYTTIPVYYDDGESFVRGEYKLIDYPDYPTEEVFPPDGTGTYEVPPEGFLKKRYRALVFKGVLIVRLCKQLPPPSFTEVS